MLRYKEAVIAEHYDLVVIGSGPGGQRAAIQAAKLGKRTAIIEKSDQLGGAALRAGTIPTKTLREVALSVSGAPIKGLLGDKRVIRQEIVLEEFFKAAIATSTTQLRVIEEAFRGTEYRLSGERRLLLMNTLSPSLARTA